MTRGVDDADLLTGDGERLAVDELAVGSAVRPGHVPEHPVGGVQQDRRSGRRRHLPDGGHMVVVGVGAGDRHDAAVADRREDRCGLVRGVDHQHLGLVT